MPLEFLKGRATREPMHIASLGVHMTPKSVTKLTRRSVLPYALFLQPSACITGRTYRLDVNVPLPKEGKGGMRRPMGCTAGGNGSGSLGVWLHPAPPSKSSPSFTAVYRYWNSWNGAALQV